MYLHIIFSDLHFWKFKIDDDTGHKYLINKMSSSNWIYGDKQFIISHGYIIDTETKKYLGPNLEPGPGSLGLQTQCGSPSGTVVELHRENYAGKHKWELEKLKDGWMKIKCQKSGYLLELSELGDKLTLHGNE